MKISTERKIQRRDKRRKVNWKMSEIKKYVIFPPLRRKDTSPIANEQTFVKGELNFDYAVAISTVIRRFEGRFPRSRKSISTSLPRDSVIYRLRNNSY